MEIRQTNRGFDLIEFKDWNEEGCSLQKSSIATEDLIWLGADDANPKILKQNEGWINYPIPSEVLFTTRMHLSQKQVGDLLPYLMRFVETGEIIKEG